MRKNYPNNWSEISTSVKKRDNYTCRKCGLKFSSNLLRVHHMVPLSKGGSNNKTNLQTLCMFCHSVKHDHLSTPKKIIKPKKSFKKFERYPDRWR